jgi:hypothetical protein
MFVYVYKYSSPPLLINALNKHFPIYTKTITPLKKDSSKTWAMIREGDVFHQKTISSYGIHTS